MIFMSATSLEKYRSGGRNRFTCPRCEAAKTFTRYVDEQGKYFADHVGRCNRESKCGYHYTPKQFFIDNPSSNNKGQWPNLAAWKKPFQAPHAERLTSVNMQAIPKPVFEETQTAPDCNFVRFLADTFGADTARDLRSKFCIGSNADLWPNSTVFWLLGTNGTPYGAQVVLYDAASGKRQKNSWIHSALSRRFSKHDQVLPEWLQAYEQASKIPVPFGLHLLKESEGKPLAIVESAKTAVIMSAIQPKALWLAVGSLSNLNEQRLMEVKGADIVLYPDLGAFEKWCTKADELKAKGFKIAVSGLLEDAATDLDRQQGFDIADYFLKQCKASIPMEPTPNNEPKPKGNIEGLPSWLALHPDGIHINEKPLHSLNLEQRQSFQLHILEAAKTDQMMKAVWDYYWLDIIA
jgi:hypothetical protein